MRTRHLPFLVVAAGLLTACPEEDLQETHPQIEVCAREDAPSAECNRPLALGDLPLTVPRTVTLFVRNIGDGDLVIDDAVTGKPDVVQVTLRPDVVTPGSMKPMEVTVTPEMLGADEDNVDIRSNDTERSPLRIKLSWNGTPKPVPRIELCADEVTGAPCTTALDIDFGTVRRSQRESRTITVRNAGDATLQITAVMKTEGSSTEGELTLVTSTRPGFLLPGTGAPLTVLYEPRDGTADTLTIVFSSDDPATPTATVNVRGTSSENLPPVADARRAGSMETLVQVSVGELVALDGSASMDPEGDPLVFNWQLFAPATSTAMLSDPSAGRVTFIPDRAGTFRVELTVIDSLGQRSEPTGLVLVEARPRYAVRATIQWESGGDVDLHLVPEGEMLFSSMDAHFGNPRPEWGGPGDDDNPSLLSDSEAAPGTEDLVIIAPQPGTYRLYAHLFDGGGPASVTATVIFNDSGLPALQVTQVLPTTCSLWHIGDIVFPASTINPGAAQPTQQCR